MGEIKVVELFAGVGGFRAGLEKSSEQYVTIWANQWEPGKKKQHAYDCYVSHFSPNDHCVNEDIEKVKGQVPAHDLLVGGFPCQDYSVARTGAKGIEGKKGVLWWSINDIIKKRKPKYILLENVDRLLKSPASQRGRDFGIMVRSLYDLGYALEWRVINAADYGQAQKRRRVFIFAYRKSTRLYKALAAAYRKTGDDGLCDWLVNAGFFADVFPVQKSDHPKRTTTCIDEMTFRDLASVSDNFQAPLYNCGVMINGNVLSEEVTPKYEKFIPLKKIRTQKAVDEKYFLKGSLDKWKYLKNAKQVPRKKPNGEEYFYTEGSMCFPDDLNSPARTLLTSESSVNRSTHVIEDYKTKNYRLLTPEECEKINGFETGWTNTGMPEKARYFMMGNALVVPLITRIGNKILKLV